MGIRRRRRTRRRIKSRFEMVRKPPGSAEEKKKGKSFDGRENK
jgi:hypothetical protein